MINNKGRILILAIIAVNLLITVISIIYLNMGDVRTGLTQQIINLVLFCVLFFFLYKGMSWARWTMVILFILSGVTGIIGGFVMLFMLVSSTFVSIMFGMSAVQLVSAALLAFSPAMKSYFLISD